MMIKNSIEKGKKGLSQKGEVRKVISTSSNKGMGFEWYTDIQPSTDLTNKEEV